jgi:glutathione synthase/RimK-type ligase-like ATP-grasp enzyme
VLRWNTDKRYLRELERAGVPVVPTVWVRGGHVLDLGSELDAQGWETAVVKPSVSAAGDRTVRTTRGNVGNGQRHLARLARTGVAMVQPYRSSVEAAGERSLIYLGGRYSHSVRRVPLFHGPATGPRETAAPASRALRHVADQAVGACPGDLLYARVDLVADDHARWEVLEVELTEPSLFFVPVPRAADTMASEIVGRLRR